MRPGDEDLIRITGARVPSGEPIPEFIPKVRTARPGGAGGGQRRSWGDRGGERSSAERGGRSFGGDRGSRSGHGGPRGEGRSYGGERRRTFSN